MAFLTPRHGETRSSFNGALRLHAHLLQSSLMPNIFLVNPNRVEIEDSTPVFDAVDGIFSSSHASSLSAGLVPSSPCNSIIRRLDRSVLVLVPRAHRSYVPSPIGRFCPWDFGNIEIIGGLALAAV